MTGAKSGGYSFPADGDYDGKYLQPSDYPYQPAYIRQSDNPPSYSPRPQYVRPRSYAQPQIQSYEQPRGQQSLSSLRDRATGMAMDYMSNGKGKSEKKDKGSKGSELLSEFFK
jgi:hypothetical protein